MLLVAFSTTPVFSEITPPRYESKWCHRAVSACLIETHEFTLRIPKDPPNGGVNEPAVAKFRVLKIGTGLRGQDT